MRSLSLIRQNTAEAHRGMSYYHGIKSSANTSVTESRGEDTQQVLFVFNSAFLLFPLDWSRCLIKPRNHTLFIVTTQRCSVNLVINKTGCTERLKKMFQKSVLPEYILFIAVSHHRSNLIRLLQQASQLSDESCVINQAWLQICTNLDAANN